MSHAHVLDFRRAKFLVLPVLFLWCFVLDVRGAEKRGGGERQPASKEDRLKERDRCAQETAELRQEGKIQEAIEACGKMLAIEREVLGEFHEDVVGSLQQLAQLHEALGDFGAAEKDLREVLAIREKLHGKEHWRVTDARLDVKDLKRRSELDPQERSEIREAQELNAQVVGLWKKGRSSEGLPLARRALEIRERLMGKESREYAQSLFNLGAQYRAAGDLEQARRLYTEALEIRRRLLGEAHPECASSLNNLGALYCAMGEYSRAEAFHREAVQIRRRVLGEAHPEYALSLNNLAAVYWDMGEYARGEPLLKEALEVTKKRLGEEHPECATSLNNLAMLYEATGDYARAEPLLKQALEITRKGRGEEHPSYGTTLINLAGVYESMGRYATAEPLYRQVVEIRKKALGEAHPDYATSIHNLGLLYVRTGEYPRAEPLLKQAIEIRKKALGEGHLGHATGLEGLANLYHAMGDHTRAESLFKQAFEIKKRSLGEAHPEYAVSLNNLANLYRDMGDYAAAERLLKQALAIRKKALGEAHPRYATSLDNLALLYQETGDYARAEPLHRQALAIKKKTLGEEHPNYATSLNKLAVLYQVTGDYRRAQPLSEQALAIRKKTLGEDHPQYATSLVSLAVLCRSLGDHARAERLLKQGLEIQKKALGHEHPDYATGLKHLGLLYRELGDYARAEPPLKKALEIRRKALGEDHPKYAVSLDHMALLYQESGDYARAEPLRLQVLEITKKALGEQHPNYAAGLTNLACLYHDRGDYARAEPFMRQALEIFGRNLELVSSAQSERQQIAMSMSAQSALSGYLCIAPLASVPADVVYGQVLARKGTVFWHQRRVRLERKRPELRPLFSELESASGRLAALAFSIPDPKKHEEWSRQIAELTRRKEELEAELSRRSAECGRETALPRISVKDLKRALPDECALIDVFEYAQRSRRDDSRKDLGPSRGGEMPARSSLSKEECHLAAFVLRKEAPVALVDLGASEPMGEAIRTWRSSFLGGPGSREEAESATCLRKRLWQPLETHLAGVRVVLVSPVGALGRLPWGALPGSSPGSFLIEERSIALLPVPQMLSELLAERDPLESPPSLLLVGDVDFGAEPSAAGPSGLGPSGSEVAQATGPEGVSSKRAPSVKDELRAAPRGGALLEFAPLASTNEEIQMVAGAFEGTYPGAKPLRLRGKEAAEAAIREAAPRHKFVHLATHGFFAPDELKSALAPPKAGGLERPDPGLGPAGDVVGWHPGLLSGIVLAGANRRPDPEHDDGILTALELATVDLGRTELMVLSACETGLGATAGGEGLLGLQRSAQMAGARTVVASLWKVSDPDALALMTRFYGNLWTRRMPKLEALREAQVAFLRGEIERGMSLGARGAGGVAPRPEEKSEAKPARVPPRAWAAWVLSGDWR